MTPESLPGELGSDFIALQSHMRMLSESFIAIGEQKAKIELVNIIVELIAEKDLSGDEIAVQVLNWLWLEISDRYPID